MSPISPCDEYVYLSMNNVQLHFECMHTNMTEIKY